MTQNQIDNELRRIASSSRAYWGDDVPEILAVPTAREVEPGALGVLWAELDRVRQMRREIEGRCE